MVRDKINQNQKKSQIVQKNKGRLIGGLWGTVSQPVRRYFDQSFIVVSVQIYGKFSIWINIFEIFTYFPPIIIAIFTKLNLYKRNLLNRTTALN